MAFTPKQQKEHREAFVKDCRQRAWAAACRAEWISTQINKLIEDYGKLKAEDEKVEGEIKTIETAVDYHTVENRAKRTKIIGTEGGSLTADYGDIEAPPVHPDCRRYIRPGDVSV
jgi:hypothetical protein